MSLIDDVKAIAKDGADLSAIEGQLGTLVNLSELPKESVWDTIKSHQNIMSVFDSEVSKRVNNGVENFKNEKMPDFIKKANEELRRELAPEETPEQKRIRELEERLIASDNEKAMSALQDKLSEHAKDLGFDQIKARDYAIYGENAIAKLEADANWMTEEINKRLDSEIKTKYKTVPPKRSDMDPADIDTKIREARAAGNSALALKLQMQKNAVKA